jgi:glycosyltransferase involved in cell wall biosynthesis
MLYTGIMNQNLRIGFDARMVYYRQAGIGQYILNLLRELATLQSEGAPFSLKVLQSRKEARPPKAWLDSGQAEHFGVQKLWTPPHHRFEQVALPVELLRSGSAVLHSPDFIPPLRRFSLSKRGIRHIKSVITVHDLAFLKFPHLLTAESKQYYGQIGQAVKSAEAIIAVSHSTARDITDLLQVSSKKITVVYEAANPLFRPLEPDELKTLENSKFSEAGLLAPETEFILFVSTIEPRKNLITLLKAFRRLVDELEGEKLPKLVIAGNKGWLFEDIFRSAQELNLSEHLIWLGGVDTTELLWLYNRAAMLAMPSLYEGFGLPPLEALACGTPVLVADISSLPEVVGDVGTKIAPESVPRWAEALKAAWQNRRNLKIEMRERGPLHAKRFSWRKAAQETLAVYQNLVKT